MATKTWQGNLNGDWFTPDCWKPAGIPQAGDEVVIASGGPSISPQDPMPLDNEQVTLGGADFAHPASITAHGATFGSGFHIAIPQNAPYAALTFDGSATFDGTITAAGSQVSVKATQGLQGSGTTFIEQGATVAFGGTVPSTQTVTFRDPNGTLLLNNPSEFGAEITGFQTGDRIELGHQQVAVSVSYADGKLKIIGESRTVIATLTLAEQGGPLNFHVSPFGHGGSILTTSQQSRTWNGGSGDWYDATLWASGVPLGGDTVSIPTGTVILSAADAATYGTLDAETITLGAAGSSAAVTLESTNASFGPALVITTRGTPQYTPQYIRSQATLLACGTTRFDGTIFHEAQGGRLTIDSKSDGNSAHFIITGNPSGKGETAPFATIFVGQESRLDFSGGTFTNNGLVLVDGHAEIGQGVVFQGAGTIEVEGGGSVSVLGSVSAGQKFVFGDDSGTLSLGNLAQFGATVELAAAGDKVHITNIQAQSLSYHAQTGTLLLHDGNGRQIGQLHITVPNGGGPRHHHGIVTADFTLEPDGKQGSMITYTPQGPVTVQASLPVAAVGTTGAFISMRNLLTAAFGTVPAGYQSYILSGPKKMMKHESYWHQPPAGTPANSYWYYDSQKIKGPLAVPANEIDRVSLYVGNSIVITAFFTVPGAADNTGPTEYIQYNIWTVDPSVDAPETAYSTPDANVPGSASRFGQLDPSDIVSSAYRYNTVYFGVRNTNNCNWIADNVTAGAGAVMPYVNAQPDPAGNVSGGFWRIVYRGSDPSPVRDWFTRTRPGDIVRMHRLDENGGHTTTVVGTINPDGSITVYDNGDHYQGAQTIGVHEATYWTGTSPATITIYRLDAKHQYLIEGTSQSEFIQGTVFNNLIRPGGGQDTIASGPRDNEIQGITAHLDGITVIGFHLADSLDFTDLSYGDATAAFADGVLTVSRGSTPVATIHLPGMPPGASFVMSPDGNGGTLVGLTPAA